MLVPETTRHRAGAYNLRVGRDPHEVAAEVFALVQVHELDWLTICEAHAYIDTLAAALRPHGYVVLVDGSHPDGSARDSAVIMRSDLALPLLVNLTRLGGVRWERKPGRAGLHWARSMTSAVTGDVRARIGAVHLPPGPFGPRFPLRRRAHRVALRRLWRLGRRWNRRATAGRSLPWVLAGDWNMSPAQRGSLLRPSPRWLADQLDAEITGDGIDYVMHRGCDVRNYRRVRFGHSDHEPVLFDVVYPVV